jgi:Cof subfamily protein (haloacid dehalogenase superfamily)
MPLLVRRSLDSRLRRNDELPTSFLATLKKSLLMAATDRLRTLLPSDTLTRMLHSHSPRDSLPKQDLDMALVKTLLGSEGSRIQHVLGVVRTAKELGSQLGEAQEFIDNLKLAALFHDIGYAESLRVTGFHPLDGALFLADQEAPRDVVLAVMLHSGADDEAPSFPGAAKTHLYDAVKGLNGHPMVEALTFCDLRTSPSGAPITFNGRLANLAERYGSEHPNTRFKLFSAPRLKEMMENVLRRVASAAPHPLPWAFIDVDSTLATPGTPLSARNRAALRGYIDRGGRVSLATGKYPTGILPIIEELGLRTPQLAGNGSVILEDGRSRLIARIDEGAAVQLARALSYRAIPYAIYSLDAIFVESAAVNEAHLQILAEINEPQPVRAWPSDWSSIFKVLTFVETTDAVTERELRALAAEMGLGCTRTAHTFVEFVPAGASKGNGVAHILGESSWPSFHTVAIGDSENDLPMLQRAGRSFAVANAAPDVLTVADRIVARCNEDGVAEVLEHMVDVANKG